MTTKHAIMEVDTVDYFHRAENEGIVCHVSTAAENGELTQGEHSWLNSARFAVEDDEVTLRVSVGDPRGALVFRVYRDRDDHIRVHFPHPSDPLPHIRLKQVSSGSYVAEGKYPDTGIQCNSCGELFPTYEVKEKPTTCYWCEECYEVEVENA